MKKFIIIIAVLVVASVGLAAWYIEFRKKGKPAQLELTVPQYGHISKTVTATGTIQPVDTITVGARVSGTIQRIYADYNDVVKKGQLIAEIDKQLFEASVNQFQANLEEAQSNLNYQKTNIDRETSLYNDKVISKSEFDLAKNQYETAAASVKSMQAQLDEAQKNLSYTRIYSPVDGLILSRNISIGQTVAASFNTPTLFIIAEDISKMQVQAAVDEADIGAVKEGQRATFTVDAYPNISFKGEVRQIRMKPQVSANVVTYTTILDAPNKDLKLKPGMTANIFIYTNEENHALLIPSKALKFKPDEKMTTQYHVGMKEAPTPAGASEIQQEFPNAAQNSSSNFEDSSGVTIEKTTVWVKSGDSLTKKEIYTGLVDDMNVQILSGLDMGDSVIVAQAGPVDNKTASASQTARSPFMPARRNTPTRTRQ